METKLKIKDGILVYGVTDKDITDVVIPDGVTTIEKNAFENCRKLKSITFPSSLREIQDCAFSDCTSLQSITLPEGFKRLWLSSINGTSITELYIPSSEKRIWVDHLVKDSKLAAIHVSPDNPYLTSIDGVLYNKDVTKLLFFPPKNAITEFKIPESVIKVPNNAFENCNNIKKLYINGAIEEFSHYMITYNMTNLESIEVSPDCKVFKAVDGVLFSKDGETLIKMSKNKNIQDYEIPPTVEKVEYYAFKDCTSLHSLTIPSSVCEIDDSAFEGCKNISTLKILGLWNLGIFFRELEYSCLADLNPDKCKVYIEDDEYTSDFEDSVFADFGIYPLSELNDDKSESDEIVEICIDDTDFSSRIGKNKIKLIGTANLNNIKPFFKRIYDMVDIAEVSFFIEDEEKTNSYWSHSGPVYGKTSTKKVDVLQRFISKIKAKTLVLPDDVMRRHINEAKKNKHIKQLQVRDTCKLFANEKGTLMNKKKTCVVFGEDIIKN